MKAGEVITLSKRKAGTLLLVLIAVAVWAACQRPETAAPRAPRPPFPPSKLPAYEPISVSGGALAAVKSGQGLVVNLSEIDIDIVTSPEFDVVWISLLQRGLVGLRQTDGDYIFFPISVVDEYFNDGEKASIALTSGEKFEGQPILARVFGKSPNGDVSVGGPDINLIKFSPGAIEKREREMKSRPANWFEGWKQPTDVTLIGDGVRALESIAVIGFYAGCDQMWIPCKPFTRNERYRNLLVNNAGFRTDLKLEDIAQLTIEGINGAQAGNREGFNVTVTLRNGETLKATTWPTTTSSSDGRQTNWVPIGLIGTDEKGFIRAFRFKDVKSITFK